MNSKTKSDSNFPALTGVRAIAAFMVFFHHFLPGDQKVGPFINSLIKEFHIGVTIFFVLSGFLIYFKYSEKDVLSKGFILNYIKNRMARIYPVYFFLIACTTLYNFFVAKNALGLQQELINLFVQFTFLKGFSYAYFPVGIGQAWTLTVEETFYFSFPILIALIRKLGFLKSLLVVYLAGGVLLAIGNTVLFQGFFQGLNFMAFYTFFGRAGEFFTGMWMASRFMKRPVTAASRGYKLPYKTILGIGGIVGCLVIFAERFTLSQTSLFTGLVKLLGMQNLQQTIFVLNNNYVLPPFVTLLFYGLLTEKSLVRWLLETPVFVLFGKSSYTFYLIHLGFIQVLILNYISPNHLVLFLLINLIAIGIYRFIEDPWRNLIRRIEIPIKVPSKSRLVPVADGK